MGPEGAANIIFRKEIMEAEDQNAMRQEKVKEYIEKFANPYVAASKDSSILLSSRKKHVHCCFTRLNFLF